MGSRFSNTDERYDIRPFKEADADALANLTVAAIRSVGARRYSPEQVAAWAARHPGPERFVERAIEGALIWVALTLSGEAVAYTLLENAPDNSGHLDMLYCHPAHTRRGIADLLLKTSENHARSLAVHRLYTEASELARPAFERAGYTLAERRDFAIEGIAIHNYAMEKWLT